ncbi:N-formylglutamate amidohydrolase [Hyphomicrobiales bacterium]|mgnify:FL=1|jgi:predicted N-formylglutamate amidohydrolase|nr:N-formylglutamate amidohydrolase [Hyphomicrobiales bacterium]
MPHNKNLNYQPFQVIEHHDSRVLLLCDHASNHIPYIYNNLNISDENLSRHIVYDIGSKGVTISLANLLKSNAILSNFSRLLIDPNRALNDPTLIMKISDNYIIPGNLNLDNNKCLNRINNFYKPYHEAVKKKINYLLSRNVVPIIISMHSFTPIFRGIERPWHISILWDQDTRFSGPLIDFLESDNEYIIGKNEPYSGSLKGDTLYRHASLNGIPHVLIEIRQDLISDAEGQQKWALYLNKIISRLLDLNGLNYIDV